MPNTSFQGMDVNRVNSSRSLFCSPWCARGSKIRTVTRTMRVVSKDQLAQKADCTKMAPVELPESASGMLDRAGSGERDSEVAESVNEPEHTRAREKEGKILKREIEAYRADPTRRGGYRSPCPSTWLSLQRYPCSRQGCSGASTRPSHGSDSSARS